MYIDRLYEKTIDNKRIYSRKRFSIPRPEFIVLYNGKEDLPAESVLKLSDMFKKLEGHDKIALELEVKVYNINKGRNPAIEKRCPALGAYSELVDRIRANESAGMERTEAVKEAVRYCTGKGILSGFLKEHGSEVENMLLTEWNWNDALQVSREEGREDGREEGEKKAWEEAGKRFSDLINHAESMDDLKKMFEVSLTKQQSGSAGS
jgi:hypothetical protein